MNNKICMFCKKIIIKPYKQTKKEYSLRKFCSWKCKNKWSKGKHFSPASEFKKGIFTKEKHPFWKGGQVKYVCKYCGKKFYYWKIKNKKYCSRTCLGKDSPTKFQRGHSGITGEKNKMWKGGITPIYTKIRNSPKYNNWRRKVFIRDGFTCCECKNIGGRLEAHHIKSFANYIELRFEISNGIALCKDCHKKTHRCLKERKIK